MHSGGIQGAGVYFHEPATGGTEIDDGNEVQVLDIDSRKPFAIVLPVNAGSITFYDVNGNTVLYQRNPL